MSHKKQSADSVKRSPSLSEGEMFGEFQDWCLRTYGDSGKTKTVTRRKYNRILQTLLQGDEPDSYADSSHINAKFKFWVKSKGFQVGSSEGGQRDRNGERPVLYVPIKAACVDGAAGQEGSSLKRVAVVEDFYDIIYAMHVEISSDPAKAPKHAGQKKTYKAIAETYAFLPREAVTRFLMSCGECQKRMHISPSGTECKENDQPASLVPDVIDYNMPLTTTYLKQMKLKCMNNNEQDESSVSSEEFDMSDPTWISAEHHSALSDPNRPTSTERMHSPQNAHKEEDDDSSSESGSGNGIHSMTPPSMSVVAVSDRAGAGPVTGSYSQVNGNGTAAPLDFSMTSSSSSSEDQQPVNLRERVGQALPTAATMLATFNPEHSEELRRKFSKPQLASDLHLDRDIRDYGNKSPHYGSGSYDSIKMEMCAEDLTVSRSQAADDDDDDHDDHDDSDKINDTEGVDPERLKAFNMFVRLFVDENLDRMVPISKQPKEKIQAIIESCSRQFPEFQERARKRIRTYLKSCRRMKKNGMETRPTPPHLTSAMAENILAAACESETRNAAKRMRMDVYQTHEDQIALDKAISREPVTHSAYSLAASAYSQDQLYINGGLGYTYRAYGGLGGSMQHPISLTTPTAQSNGPTDLSMKSLASNSSTSSSSSLGRSAGGGTSAQLSHTEVAAVRQLIAGYRESAAFLLRSADELENLILQQN
ncbi:nucleolar protein 4-like b isoform X1 [Pygocentrus nattereri]|uniref:Nucleolar protein 4 helical domain-containing protein n=2 Tax=Pygocentrus nattereri TaxID=42514 RepID=A0A3B4DYS8_PYGNA|nr:nucleolar protein 4-like b isoform X1 [Pygocentrus nattereri]